MARNANPNNYYRLRKLAIERDGFKCTECGSQEKLEVHHIKSFTHCPELRYEISNCKTLCRTCHKKSENYGGKLLKGKRHGAFSYN